MSNNMTFKRQFENYRPNEYINAVRLAKETEFVMITEPNDYDDYWYDETHARPIPPPEQFVTGPIIDRLAAYERTYMEPEEIKELQDDAKCMRDKIESLEKELKVWKGATEELKRDNADLKKQLKEAKQETQKWVDNRQMLRVEYDKLLNTATDTNNLNVKFQQENARLAKENKELKKSIEAWETLCTEKSIKISNLEEENGYSDRNLELELVITKDELAEARNIIKNHATEINDCRRVNKELREMYEDKSGECDDLRKDNAILKHNLNSKGWDRLSKIIEQLEQELESKNSTIASLEKYIEDQKHIKKIQAQVCNSIYGSPFRGGAIYPKFPVDINDLIAKLREHKDIMVSVSQYDDSTTVNVTPWTPPVEEEETSFQEDLDFFVNECTKAQLRELYNQVSKKLNMIIIEEPKWSEVTEVMRELRMRLDDNNIHCFMAYCASKDEVDIHISRKRKK